MNPDITIANLIAQLPVGSITVAAGDATFSLSAITGDTGITGATPIAEFTHKLLRAAEKAQTVYNEANLVNDPDLNAYPEAFTGSPQTIDGDLYVGVSHTVNVRIPLDANTVVAATL